MTIQIKDLMIMGMTGFVPNLFNIKAITRARQKSKGLLRGAGPCKAKDNRKSASTKLKSSKLWPIFAGKDRLTFRMKSALSRQEESDHHLIH